MEISKDQVTAYRSAGSSLAAYPPRPVIRAAATLCGGDAPEDSIATSWETEGQTHWEILWALSSSLVHIEATGKRAGWEFSDDETVEFTLSAVQVKLSDVYQLEVVRTEPTSRLTEAGWSWRSSVLVRVRGVDKPIYIPLGGPDGSHSSLVGDSAAMIARIQGAINR